MKLNIENMLIKYKLVNNYIWGQKKVEIIIIKNIF